jgi:thioredoxin reductase (NADPH)
MENKEYDLIILGTGPAGLTAALYAGRYLLKTLVIGELNGGAISEAAEVCNFPTYKSITGMELTTRLVEQVKNLEVEIVQDRVKRINKNKNFEIETDNSIYKSKKLIIATGRKKLKLNIKKEDELIGRGISYCATCDASFFREKIVSVIGGSNASLTAALLLSKYAKKVYIIYRQEKFFRAEPSWIKQVELNKKIEIIFNSEIKEIKGSEKVEGIVLDSEKEISLDGIFIEIGSIPDIKIFKNLDLELEENYIVTDKFQKTSVSGIFAAGDITNNSLKQAITASSEGAIAATSAYNEIKKEE